MKIPLVPESQNRLYCKPQKWYWEPLFSNPWKLHLKNELFWRSSLMILSFYRARMLPTCRCNNNIASSFWASTTTSTRARTAASWSAAQRSGSVSTPSTAWRWFQTTIPPNWLRSGFGFGGCPVETFKGVGDNRLLGSYKIVLKL